MTTTSTAASGTSAATFAAPSGFVAPAVAVTIPLDNVLEVLVEGYLLGDLESMATEINSKEIGAVGYPMAMTVLAGSELLGALTSDVADTNRIEEYWTIHLATVNKTYGDLGEIASDLYRNGIAHSYLSRLGVVVLRGDPDRHLQLTGDGVVLDCIELYKDFRRSYEDYAKLSILDDASKAQERFNKLVQHDHLKAKLVENLPPERWPRTAVMAPLSPSGVLLATPIDETS